LAIGVFGQYICIHPIAQVVTVIQSVWRQGANVETLALLRAAVCALKSEHAWWARPARMAAQRVPACLCWVMTCLAHCAIGVSAGLVIEPVDGNVGAGASEREGARPTDALLGTGD
jgi:hypothetical protein